jgi:hypothetical protein
LAELLKLQSQTTGSAANAVHHKLLDQILVVINAIENVSSHFFEDQFENWRSKRKTTPNPTLNPTINQSNDVGEKSDLGMDTKKRLLSILENGIENIDELIDIVRIISIAGNQIDPAFMNRINEAIGLFIDIESKKQMDLPDLIQFLTFTQNLISSEFDRVNVDVESLANQFYSPKSSINSHPEFAPDTTPITELPDDPPPQNRYETTNTPTITPTFTPFEIPSYGGRAPAVKPNRSPNTTTPNPNITSTFHLIERLDRVAKLQLFPEFIDRIYPFFTDLLMDKLNQIDRQIN